MIEILKKLLTTEDAAIRLFRAVAGALLTVLGQAQAQTVLTGASDIATWTATQWIIVVCVALTGWTSGATSRPQATRR